MIASRTVPVSLLRMRSGRWRAFPLILGTTLLTGPSLPAAEPGAGSAEALQRQIDELKAGQREILRELQALRAALAQPSAPVEQPVAPQLPPTLNIQGEPFRGARTATVAIITYSDFDCSHCATFATTTLPELHRRYIATGKVRYYFRDLPDRQSEVAFRKARLARCAGEQGLFWETHDHLVAAQPKLTGEAWKADLAALGLDVPKVEACLAAGRHGDVIKRSAEGAWRMGFRGTPTFVIGRLTEDGDFVRVEHVLLGTEDIGRFQGLIDGLLTTAN
jgi:hypothetical protein